MAARVTSFCYIEPHKITFVGSNSATPLSLPLTPDMVSDLEVVSRDKIVNLVSEYIKARQIKPALLVLILAPTVTFDREVQNISPKDQNTFVQKFKDAVPFESVVVKSMTFGTKFKISAANHELYDSIRTGFERAGFTVTSIVPLTLLATEYPELSTNIDANLIISKFDSLGKYGIVEHEIIKPDRKLEKKGLQGRKDMALVGIFGVLAIVLGYMIYANFVVHPKVVQTTNLTPIPTKPLVFPTQQASSSSTKVATQSP